jgi:hypothetical protein
MTEFNVPDALPTLSAGPHVEGSGKACVMEYISLLAGEKWTDMPLCTLPLLAAAAQVVNDMATDEDRHLLVPLIGRLFGSSGTGKYTLHQAHAMLSRYVMDRAHRLARVYPVHGVVLFDMRRHLDVAVTVPVLDPREAETIMKLTPEARVRFEREFAPDANAAANLARSFFTVATEFGGTGLAVAELSMLLDEYDMLTGRAPAPELSAAQLAGLAVKLAASAAAK